MVNGLSNFSQMVRGQQSVPQPVMKPNTEKHNPKAVLVGGAIGMAVPSYTVYESVKKMTTEDARSMADYMKLLMPEADTLENTKNVASKILEETGLKSKGVKINFVDGSKESLDSLSELIKNEVGQNSVFSRQMGRNYYETFKEGANAAFFPKGNQVVVNSKNLFTTVYHELGHSMNANGNWFTKGLQKARAITPFGVSLLAPVFLAVGLLHKVDNEKPKEQKGFVEKSLDFMANNAGKLTLATYIPMLAEEGLASVRGLKAASKHLPKDIMGKLGKNYAVAWCTYAATAAVISAGVALGVRVANNIKSKKAQAQG